MESPEGFVKSTESQIECATGIDVHRENIKLIDKGDRHAFCLAFNEIETWEHVVSCDKMKDKRDGWINSTGDSLNDVVKKAKKSKRKRNIFNEMFEDVRNFFN